MFPRFTHFPPPPPFPPSPRALRALFAPSPLETSLLAGDVLASQRRRRLPRTPPPVTVTGAVTIPRALWLDGSGKQLVQWPVKEVEKLRGKRVEAHGVALGKGDHFEIKGITASQVLFGSAAEIELLAFIFLRFFVQIILKWLESIRVG